MTNSPLLTRAEAARWCRVSVAAFDAHVRPHLPVKRIGRRVVFHRADLEAWALAEATAPKPEFKGAPSLRPVQLRRGWLLDQLLEEAHAKKGSRNGPTA